MRAPWLRSGRACVVVARTLAETLGEGFARTRMGVRASARPFVSRASGERALGYGPKAPREAVKRPSRKAARAGCRRCLDLGS